MKKRMILITITLLVIAIVFCVYISHRTITPLSLREQFPVPNPHEHTAPDGTVVKHIHSYKNTDTNPNTDTVKPAQGSDIPHPIQRAWERLDLTTIRKKYQPYTLAEMKEMWYKRYLDFGIRPENLTEAEKYYPLDEWLEDLMDLGHPFVGFGHYQLALDRRFGMMGPTRKSWDTGVPHIYESGMVDSGSKIGLLHELQLPPDTTWKEYIDIHNKFSVVRLMNVLRAQEADPDVEGGLTNLDGSFLPFSPNVVHVHVSPETGRVKFIGARLTAAEEDALVNYGASPKGMSVVYVDAKNHPLPPDKVPPRFYERRMKSLEEAQNLLQQQIKDHEALLELDVLPTPSEKGKQTAPTSHDHTHDLDHTHEMPESPETVPPQQRLQPDAKRIPPQLKIPPELRKLDAVNQWFTELEALHGGQLPKDLKELRKIIDELEKIKREGEAKLKPSQRPAPPSPPDAVPPEESSPTPPDEED